MPSLKQAVKLYRAWQSIKNDSVDLNLDAAQNRETDNNLRRANETVDARIKETYCWLLVPYIDKSTDMKTIVWDNIRISGGSESIIAKAAKKMLQNEAVITEWAPALLRMELDNLLWRDADNISVKKLWEYLCTYCYLPRLANEHVLYNAIQTGVNSTEYFAFASNFDESRYIDLKFNQYIGIVERSGYLVKVDVARGVQTSRLQNTFTAENTQATPSNIGTRSEPTLTNQQTATDVSPNDVPQNTVTNSPKNTHFYMSAELDNTRIGRDVQKLVEEVINHLTAMDGAQVEVSLEVAVQSPDGISPQTVRTVSENCRTLKVRDFGFEG
jgi:hypothetical protein